MPSQQVTAWKWLRTGEEALAGMLAAIDSARASICLETYIYADDAVGRRFLNALTRARQRGLKVRVLVDAVGSLTLSNNFWKPLRDAGGEARIFNPVTLNRFFIRNHRKLLVCDDAVAFVGGYNITTDYEGDGIARGWKDLGVRLEGVVVAELAATFDTMFDLAEFKHKRFARLRRPQLKGRLASPGLQILLGGPGRSRSPIKVALNKDLKRARAVQLMVAYFLPTGRLRRNLLRAARRSGSVQLVLAGKSDIPASQLAAQSMYRRLLKTGVRIFEYQPQILHAKLFVIDDVVYVGSANLDPRSLGINYELMLRFENAKMASEAREIFASTLENSREIKLGDWLRQRTFWARLKSRWAHFLLSRVDPHMARRQWKGLPD
jgi:cardiolipin synthase